MPIKYYVSKSEGDIRLRRIWYGMKSRCNDLKNPYYGGKGVSICQEWINSFDMFYSWAMSNGYRSNLSIDRIDHNGDYCPDNCRWADAKIQANNTSRTLIEIFGEIKTVANWACDPRCQVPLKVLARRMKKCYY